MAGTQKDPYSVLGVDRNADEKTISAAYKKLARKFHPDFNPGNKRAEEKFKEVNEAYDTLKDPKKRQNYDQFGSADPFNGAGNPFGQGGNPFGQGGNPFGGAGNPFGDIFGNLFGGGASFGGAGGRGSSRRTMHFNMGGNRPAWDEAEEAPKATEMEISVTLEEVVDGASKTILVKTPSGMKNLTVSIPAGFEDGKKLRLAGQGGTDAYGRSCDLLLKVCYADHAVFSVKGKNLECDLPVAPWEIIFGKKVTVPTLKGEVEIALPTTINSGAKLRIKGRGLGKANDKGDLFVRIMIKIPTHLSEKERELWKALEEASSNFSPRS